MSLKDLREKWTLKDDILYVLWWPYRFWTYQVVYLPKEIKWHWQRAFRGWADCDVWSMDNHLSRLIEEMTAYLAKNHVGHPADMTDERWTNRLLFVSRSFRDYRKWQEESFYRKDHDSDEYKIKENLIQENWDKAWEVFHKRYDSLWD
jgi:hypothetical protein